MRHGAENRNIEKLGCEDRGSASKAGNVARAGGQESGLGTMSTPESEINEVFARRGEPCALPWTRSAIENARC
jgi:hypothetical protein